MCNHREHGFALTVLVLSFVPTHRKEENMSGLVAARCRRTVVTLSVTLGAGKAIAADDKACPRQERTNKTLSEKLMIRAACPPDLAPASMPPTPCSWVATAHDVPLRRHIGWTL
jgi:hypothetical protein